MKVTQIVELSKSRSKVYIEHEFAFVLYKGELRLYKIKEGAEITEDIYRTIMDELLPKRAKLRAMNLLQSREYTCAQLQTKLRQGYYPEEVIVEALNYVSSFRYIDDMRYATDYISYHESNKSRRRIEQDLMRKGIAADIIAGAWTEWENQGGEQNEQAMILRLLEKKQYSPEATDYKEKQKIFAFLQRKGFSVEVIRRAMCAELNIW